jgi:hypothetical protein
MMAGPWAMKRKLMVVGLNAEEGLVETQNGPHNRRQVGQEKLFSMRGGFM